MRRGIDGTPIRVNTAYVLTMRIDLPEAKYLRPDNEIAFHEHLKTRIDSLPGVEVTAVASNLPLAGWMDFTCELENVLLADRGQAPNVRALVVRRYST